MDDTLKDHALSGLVAEVDNSRIHSSDYYQLGYLLMTLLAIVDCVLRIGQSFSAISVGVQIVTNQQCIDPDTAVCTALHPHLVL